MSRYYKNLKRTYDLDFIQEEEKRISEIQSQNYEKIEHPIRMKNFKVEDRRNKLPLKFNRGKRKFSFFFKTSLKKDKKIHKKQQRNIFMNGKRSLKILGKIKDSKRNSKKSKIDSPKHEDKEENPQNLGYENLSEIINQKIKNLIPDEEEIEINYYQQIVIIY